MSDRRDPQLDPAVRAILGEQHYKQQVRHADKKTRQQLKRQKARHRVTLELHPAVVAVLRQIAAHEGCSPAAACNYLLAHAALDYDHGVIDFFDAKRGSDSNRWEFVVLLDELLPELEQMAKQRAKGALGGEG